MHVDPTLNSDLPDDPFVTWAHDRAYAALMVHEDNAHAVLSVPEGAPVEWWLLALADCPEGLPVTLIGYPGRGEPDVWDDTDTAQAFPPLAWWLDALGALPAGTLVTVNNLPDYTPNDGHRVEPFTWPV